MDKKEIFCLKCKRKLKETDEVAFVNEENTEVLCDKCWKKQPYMKLKDIR